MPKIFISRHAIRRFELRVRSDQYNVRACLYALCCQGLSQGEADNPILEMYRTHRHEGYTYRTARYFNEVVGLSIPMLLVLHPIGVNSYKLITLYTIFDMKGGDHAHY